MAPLKYLAAVAVRRALGATLLANVDSLDLPRALKLYLTYGRTYPPYVPPPPRPPSPVAAEPAQTGTGESLVADIADAPGRGEHRDSQAAGEGAPTGWQPMQWAVRFGGLVVVLWLLRRSYLSFWRRCGQGALLASPRK